MLPTSSKPMGKRRTAREVEGWLETLEAKILKGMFFMVT